MRLKLVRHYDKENGHFLGYEIRYKPFWWWTLDVDNDTEIHPSGPEFTKTGFQTVVKTIKLVDVLDTLIPQMKRQVDLTKTRSGDEIFTVPIKNGFHVMTPPFRKDYLFDCDAGLFRLGDNLKTDAMTLIYFQWED